MKDHHNEDMLHGSSAWIHKFEKYLPEMVYGSIDGIVTTFAVVAGAAGANLTINIVLILGMANLFADGLSMSIGSYLSKKSEQDNYNKHKRVEEWEIENLPDMERKEIEAIYKSKGFEGDELNMVVHRITSDKKVWLETMMKDELGLMLDQKSPLKAGFSTFLSFVFAGAIPLIAYVLTFTGNISLDPFLISSSVTALTFILIGYLKTYVTQAPAVKTILETLFLGATAAVVAFLLGHYLEKILL